MAQDEDAQAMPPGPDPALKRLDKFVGTWNVKIVVRLDRRTYSPVLRQADLPEVTVPWWPGRTLRFEYA